MEKTDGITLAYIVITCGLTPCLYFLGIPEHRQKLTGIVQSVVPERKPKRQVHNAPTG